jgi:carbon-monoxide dehydrogenase large subunit
MAAFLPILTQLMLSGVYQIPKIGSRLQCVATNTTPVNAYRGAGRPEAAALIERAVDMLADELGLDPADIRRRNFIPKDAFPYTTASGATYDVGDYELALDEALRLADYEALRAEQAERRRQGAVEQLGIGLSCYVEVTAYGLGNEFGSVEVHPDGTVTALTGTSPHGQGHVTAFAQIVADTLRVPFEAVTVVHSDTAVVPKGEGTMGSRSAQVGGSAVLRAGEAVVDKARNVAAHLLEAAPEDVELSDEGRIGIVGAPDRSFSWAELAEAATTADSLPEGMEPGLAARDTFSQASNGSYPFGAHVAVVEVDTETGFVHLVRHVAVDDCGRILNPLLVEGQVHGGLAQGIAQALYEEVLYDEDGNPLTGSLLTYEMPSAAEFPSFETAHTVTPTPLNPLGAKGIGESATIGSTPAVQNAVVDAVSHLGVRHIDLPLTPERVWRAIREAQPPGS